MVWTGCGGDSQMMEYFIRSLCVQSLLRNLMHNIPEISNSVPLVNK